ncbi:sodium/bile acid cotransporter 7 [Coccidioides posadasii str. Silveira]|uniref:Sodium/bile acid cotransporter 7 n=1 Tax=Coccidioides posadasii (strain RMSCC 757 / Silveira) TaxID=443226 RepID=E9D1C6_COCPS|nr:sodium/bile acid cotransporter 7 [Coccidioides posadasii str. Silveira]
MESQATNYQANSEKQAPPSSIIGAFILRQYLLIGIGISCLLAYFFPNVAKHGGIIHAEYSILYGAVAIIFLISGLSIAKEKLILQLLNYRVHILVQGISFLVVPAIMVAFVQLIYTSDHGRRIDEAVLAGYILVGCLPTTISSNVAMTREAGGDDAVALMEVLVANMLGPFVTPGWTVTLLPKSPSFDLWRHADSDLDSLYRQVFQSLGLSVLIPLVLGQVIRWTWPQQAKHVVETFHFSKISGCCLILLTCRIFRRLPPVETIAVCFCGPAKTIGLGIPMLYAMYKSNDVSLNARMSVPVILYTTEQIFSAHFMVHLFRAWLRKLRKKEETSSRNVELAVVML